MMKFIFGMQIKKHQNVLQVDTITLSVHAQRTQNKKFAYLCNISRKNVGDEVDFLAVHKHKSFLQVDSITLSVCSEACPKYPK